MPGAVKSEFLVCSDCITQFFQNNNAVVKEEKKY